MRKAKYQNRFTLTTELVIKPNSRQQKTLKEAAKKSGKGVTEYANMALTKSLIEEDR